jgi:hypothetical protein
MKKARQRESVIGLARPQCVMQALSRLVECGHAFRIKRRGRPEARLLRP